MEILATIGLIVGVWFYYKVKEEQAITHSNTYDVDWGKVNEDRIMNNLSQSQTNDNIANGKYDRGRW